LVLFGVASVGCALAPDIETLIVWRFVQGLGASAGMVIPRAIVRDLHTGVDAARLMSLLMLVFSVSPILAPLCGSLLIEWVGWRSVFWAVTGIAIFSLVILFTGLAETRSVAERAQSTLRGALAGYWELLRDRHFLGLVFIGAFGMASFFSFLANSPFVMIDHYGLTPRQYSMAFAVNAASFIGVSQFTGKLAARFGLQAMVKFAVTGYAIVMALLLLVWFFGVGGARHVGAGAGGAWGHCGHCVSLDGHLAVCHRGRSHGRGGAVCGWQPISHGGGHCRLCVGFFRYRQGYLGRPKHPLASRWLGLRAGGRDAGASGTIDVYVNVNSRRSPSCQKPS
jgi:MFS transporter, DHA1 family, multidrug resistance protein